MAEVSSFVTSGHAVEKMGRFNKEGQCQDIAQLCILHTPYILKKHSFVLSENTRTFHYWLSHKETLVLEEVPGGLLGGKGQ